MRTLNSSLLESTVKARIDSDIELGNIGGAAAVVLQNGKTVCDLRVGFKNVATGEKLTKNTLFRFASLTKPVAAVACMIAVEKGYFSLEDKVSDYFPEIKNMYVGKLENGTVLPDRKAQNDILIRDLLSHTSGIMGSNALAEPQEYIMPHSAYETNKAMVDYVLKHTCLTFEPTKASAYSGYAAFDIIALIIEQKSGLKFAQFIDKYIFKPLSIRDITFNPNEEQWSRMITMTDKVVGNKCATVDLGKHTFEGFNLNYTCAGASLTGTVEDYTVFAEMLRRGGEYGGVRILKPLSVAAISTPYVPLGTPGLYRVV